MINIVYDMDDVLNNLNDVVFSRQGIYHKLVKLKYFDINKNKNMTKYEKSEILKSYSNPDIFDKLELVYGAERILDIQKKYSDKVKVWIHSLSFNDKIAQVKERFIRDKMQWFNMDNTILEVADTKSVLDFADIVVEDSLEYLVKCKSEFKVLIDKSYNQSENYDVDSSNIIREKGLNKAIDKVESIVEELLSNGK